MAKTMFGFEGPCPCPPNETINSKSLSVENIVNNSGTANTAHTARKNALDEFMCHRSAIILSFIHARKWRSVDSEFL